jgi:oxaloacetate decarboxylase alpha subunit
MTYLKAIEAGVDVVDTATVPLAFGASQPATEMLVTALKGTPYDTELDLDSLFAIAEYWEKVREEGGFERGVTSLTHMRVYSHQVPGGMISNLISQLKEQKAEDRLQEVLEEIPRVREEVGYPPLVTPMSQIVGTQAVLNVLIGKRWQVVPDEMKAYLRGRYGRAPGPINPDIMRRVLGDEQPISGRPADLIEETLDQYREEIGPLARSEEDVLSYALFPSTARKFFERRHSGAEEDVFLTGEPEPAPAAAAAAGAAGATDRVRELIAAVEAADIDEVTVEDAGVRITIRKGGYRPPGEGQAPVGAPILGENAESPAAPEVPDASLDTYHKVVAPMVGTFYASPSPTSPAYVTPGQHVDEGDVLCILEAMKLMNEFLAEFDLEIVAVLAENAKMVEFGTPLFEVRKL